jgi:DNA-binding NarL/FixJ family response regulator
MNRLIFIDDDQTELDAFGNILKGKFTYVPVHWPQESATLSTVLSPDIIVSDLYLPSPEGDREPTADEREEAERASQGVSKMFEQLYGDSSVNDKARLQLTMRAISRASALLKLQWSSMGQSPSNGIELMATLRRRFPEVPFIFYSRKITPEDVVRVFDAGADDAIRKGAMKDDAVIRRIEAAVNKRVVLREHPADTQREESGNSDHTALSWLKKGTIADTSSKWLTVLSKLVAIGAGVFGLLLGRAKFLDWINKGGTGVASRVPTPVDSVALVLGWYLLVWLLLISGDVFYRIFVEAWKGILWLVRRITPFQKVKDSTFTTLQESVPKLFHIAWDTSVILLAVFPALRYAAQFLAR